MRREIGFIHSAPTNRDLTWEMEVNGIVFTFKKVWEKFHFLYNCQCSSTWKSFHSSGSTGFYSERDFTKDEVERLPQFADFISQRRVSLD